MHFLRQSTAVDVSIGPFVDSTDAYTAETGLSPAVKLSKNGQALAAKNDATTPVHQADGYYNCELDATDTNTVGTLRLSVAGSATALPVFHDFQVVEEAVYDAMFASGAVGPLEANDTGTGLTAVPWNSAWDAEVQSECDDAITANALINAIAGYLDTEIAAILADTNELQTDWANGGRLDNILDARAAQTTADAIETDTQNIQSRIPAALSGGRMASDAEAISGSTEAADDLEASAKTIVVDSVDTGYTETTTTLKGGGTATLSSVNDHYNGRVIIFTSGTLQNQATDITDYDGTTNVFTVTALTGAPSDGDSFVIV